MTLFSIECSRCAGECEVRAEALLVEVDADVEDEAVAGVVHFLCDSCADLVALPVDWTALVSLVTAGAALLEEDLTDPRPAHPEAPAAGGPLTLDHLLELHETLADDSWFDRLARACPAH